MAESDPQWDPDNPDNHPECYDNAYNRLIAQLFLENADQSKYGSILRNLSSQFSLKQDQYPKNITHAVSFLHGL